ncbi:MAG TPA: hypothetical protein VGC27_10580 [Rhizomicrobium sp.]
MNAHTPPIAYLDDMSLSHLNTAELLLTATLRLYVLAQRGAEGECPDWRNGMLTTGVRPCAVVAFDVLVKTILGQTQQALDVRCPLCPKLGADEGRFLQMTSLLQQQRFGAAHAILGQWLPPLAQAAMMSPAVHVAFACASRGLRVPWRHGDTEMLAYFDVPCGDPGVNFVH